MLPPVAAVIFLKTSAVCQPVLEGQDRPGAPGLAGTAEPPADPDRPVEEGSFDRRSLLHAGVNPAVDLLVDPGHGDDVGRFDFAEIVAEGLQTLGVGDGEPVEVCEGVDDPLQDVGQRQEGDESVVLSGLERRGDGFEFGHEVAVGKDDPFGIACGPGRVDDCDRIIGCRAAGQFREIRLENAPGPRP